MAHFNDCFISFVGTEEQMRKILLVMARNQLAAFPVLVTGEDDEPDWWEEIEGMGASRLADFLTRRAEDPLFLLNPMTDNFCSNSGGYSFDRPHKIHGTDWFELDMGFCSGQFELDMGFCSGQDGDRLTLDDLGVFGTLLPSGTYSFGAAFHYEGDERFYIDWGDFQCGPKDADDFDKDKHFWYQDESVRPGRRKAVLEALQESARADSPLSYVAVSLAHAVGDWLYLDDFSSLKHAKPARVSFPEDGILELLGEFPLTLGVWLQDSPAGVWQKTASGTPLIVTSDWTGTDDVELRVADAKGAYMGTVYRLGDLSKMPYETEENDELGDLFEEIALILPALQASFHAVNPDTAFALLEFAGPVDVGKLVENARGVASRPAGERSLSTREGE